MRLTKKAIQQLLDLNEGFTKTKHYSDRNFKETNHYLIEGGKLLKRSVGKTSWADSRYDKITVATIEQTRKFLRDNLKDLNKKGIE